MNTAARLTTTLELAVLETVKRIGDGEVKGLRPAAVPIGHFIGSNILDEVIAAFNGLVREGMLEHDAEADSKLILMTSAPVCFKTAPKARRMLSLIGLSEREWRAVNHKAWRPEAVKSDVARMSKLEPWEVENLYDRLELNGIQVRRRKPPGQVNARDVLSLHHLASHEAGRAFNHVLRACGLSYAQAERSIRRLEGERLIAGDRPSDKGAALLDALSLSKLELDALKAISRDPDMPSGQVMEASGLSPQELHSLMTRLEAQGVQVRKLRTPNAVKCAKYYEKRKKMKGDRKHEA